MPANLKSSARMIRVEEMGRRKRSHQYFWNALGERLSMARDLAGLTQEQAGKAIGLGRTSMVNIESGEQSIDALQLVMLAQLYAIPLQKLTPNVTIQPTNKEPSA